MKQTLHWNVSGIPPEARDVARAAATKEGLTVGDWLTRRILAERGAAALTTPADRNQADLETKPMGPRLVRLDGNSEAPPRQGDDPLGILSKRIEAGEWAQNETQRSLAALTSELQLASHDQAEAFTRIAERIERVEKNTDTTALRDAVRGLHQGVALLTEQIARTASESAGQVGVLASSIEVMAVKIGSMRDESVRLERTIDERLNGFSERVRQLEERVKTAPGQQALETRIETAEKRMREAFSHHIAAVERNVAAIATRLDEADQARGQGFIQETIATLNRRFETSERRSKEVFTSLQSGLSEATARITRLEGPATAEARPPAESEPAISTVAVNLADLRSVAKADAEIAVELPRTNAPGTREYLAQTRRAAQASGDTTTSSVWQIPGVIGAARERSRVARISAQAFLILLVMCSGFLLMRYFGPQIEQMLPTKAATISLPNTPEFRALQARAIEGLPIAELLLGLKLADGDGVPANNVEAARWLERAASKGQALAMYRLGTLHEKGLGVPADTRVAADWYAKAAETGNVKAMHNLAVAHANGNGRETNFNEAAHWFRQAADRGLADSQFNLAVLYERGLGVGTSLVEAYKWYAIAAAQGDNESSTRVEALVSQIPAPDRLTAERAAEAFKATPPDVGANEAPLPSQVLN